MKTNLFSILLTGALCYFQVNIHAQDVHFSQMEFSPLTLNPGLAGANSPMQGVVNYRSQWNSVAIPYKTIAASFDARFNEDKRNKKGIIAGGINFFNDQSGDMKVNTTNVNLNLAYHLILDKTSTLGIGIYTGFGQRSIDPNAGRWGSQYDGTSYNSAISSGETFNSASFNYVKFDESWTDTCTISNLSIINECFTTLIGLDQITLAHIASLKSDAQVQINNVCALAHNTYI
jgi:type IX secretion system PorP/SprF family membrane protein